MRLGRIYAITFSACALAAVLAVFALPIIQRDSVQTVVLNGKVLLGYSNSVPTGLTFVGAHGNFSAVVGDTTASCACGGYYYLVTLPNRQTYAVDIYYTSSNATRVCHTKLSLSSSSGTINELIRCP